MAKTFIGPYKEGLQRNLEPMWLPNEAFETLEDVYVWRGRVKKKSGYSILGRLHNEGTTAVPIAAGNIATGAYTVTLTPFAAADLPLSPGTVTITITVGVALWPAVMTFVDNGNGTLTCSDAPIAGGFTMAYGIIDYITGSFDLFIDPIMPAGGPFAVAVTAFRHVPQLSCMGLGSYEQTVINREGLIAFDEDFSYLYNTATNVFDPLDDGAGAIQTWNGSNSNFFWTWNYYQDGNNNYLFWATNNVANSVVGPQTQDGIQIYNGTNWTAQTPVIDAAANQLRGCLILISYKDRMIALNTLEGAVAPAGATRYPNRARWSQNGVPYTTTLAGADATAWRQDQVGHGGYIDAPTREAIVSAAFIKDTLLVFFERSTWQLRYTGNELLPFVWEKINAELGSEGTFSSVPFDKGVMTVGDKGIYAANSINVERIDEKVPNLVFNIHNDNNGPIRVHGIRDYYNKLVYWCYPSDDVDGIFPEKVITLNYDEGNYAIFNDTFTCFGYWQDTTDYTWATLPYTTWSSWDLPWGSPIGQSYFPTLVAGNHRGFVLKLNQGVENSPYTDLNVTIAIPDSITNATPPVVQVTNHNLYTGQFVKIYYTRGFTETVTAEAVGTAEAGSTSFTGTLDNLGIFPASAPTGAGPTYNTIVIGALTYTDLGNGTLLEAAGVLTGTIDYENATFTVNFGALGADTAVTANYQYNILNFRVFYINRLTANTFSLYSIDVNGNTQPVALAGYGAAYQGWGEISQISNFTIRTKRFNPYLPESDSFRMVYYDILLERSDMTFQTTLFADEDSDTIINQFNVACFDETGSGLAVSKAWQRIYANLISDFVQLEFNLSNLQIIDRDNYASDFTFHAMIIETAQAGRIINRP